MGHLGTGGYPGLHNKFQDSLGYSETLSLKKREELQHRSKHL